MKTSEKYRDIFDSDIEKEGLKRKAVSGGIFTMGAEGINFVLRLGSIAILARLLVPEHFGLISMVTAITAVAERFKDLGLSLATVQKKEITHDQVTALFWINAIFGVLVMIIISCLSKLIAWFYADSRLIWITLAISTSFFFGGMTVQHQAILRRKMRYGVIGGINIVSNILSILVSIIIALIGYGYWALVWREISRSLFLAIGSWVFCPWMPGLPRRNARIGSLMRFGRDITGFNLINVFTQNLDQVLMGKFYGPNLLGIYRQACQLILIPLRYFIHPIHFVAESTLSILQYDGPRYRQYYKKIVTLLSFFSMPLAIFIFVHSKDIILLLLGEKWIDGAVIMKILALGAFIQPAASTTGFVMISCGKSKRYLLLGIVGSIIYVSAVCIGVRWGGVGVAIGYVLSAYIYFLPMVFTAFRDTPIHAGLFLCLLIQPVISSLIMGMALTIFVSMSPTQNSLLAIIKSIPVGLAAYLVAWIVIPGGMLRLKEIISEAAFVFEKLEKREGRGV